MRYLVKLVTESLVYQALMLDLVILLLFTLIQLVFEDLLKRGNFFKRGFFHIPQKFMDRLYKFAGFFLYILLIVSYEIIQPYLPQQLGGMQPRCAVLDIDKRELSEKTINTLTGETANTSSQQPVIRTAPLALLFVGSSYVLVRRYDINIEINIEIKSAAVKATLWC